uniref:ODAD1 central coiled coil region domain-containing protein n=1 Tax=Strombidium inclinatum TaxID=197538 RepID=A0A7S3IZE9_9SPIT|mmetsp:Transcript_8517/g.13108  ORF Transcript_8517/g.13108 Transcript_8517/m.13108 type:complete len:255 (+) Transcript_8517:638-1402(+)
MDIYVRNVNVIEDAFTQMKQATGISSTEEVVTTFIKAEEQNYSLYNYVNMLNSEIDMIEEHNKAIETEIKRHEELGDMTEKEKEIVRQKLSEKVEESNALHNEKDQQIKLMEKNMVAIKDSVWRMVDEFKKSNFFLSVAQSNQYDDETVFNENNVTHYLAELEEYISLFMTYMACKQNDPNAPTVSIPFESMNVKEFDKTKMNIEPPSSNEVNLANEDAETEEDMTTDPRALFKKFEDMKAREEDITDASQLRK